MEHEYYLGKLNYKSNVRLLLLHPISPRNGHEGPFHLPQYDYLLTTTHLDEIFCSGAPRSIESSADNEKIIPFIVEKAIWAESQGYDALIINCMLDPGVSEAKRAVSIPVIGLREATRALATLVGTKPAHIYPKNIPVLKLSYDEEKTFRELVKIGREQINDNGANVLIPNCGYLGGLAQRLQMELGVPVLANLDIALKLAELFAIFDVRPNYNKLDAQRVLSLHKRQKESNALQQTGITSRVKSFIKRCFY
jgi:Asp/Glu/hydantoin racemase